MRRYLVEGVTGAFTLLLLVICVVASKTASGAEQINAAVPKTAVFNFELIDTSEEGQLNGKREDQTARLALLSKILRERLAASRRYDLVDMAPAAKAIKDASPLHDCNDCIGGLAKSVGAAIAFTGYVQKVSNLILNVNLIEWNANTGKRIKTWSVDIRGNTDESWSRGLNYILDNRLLVKEAAHG